MKEKINKVNEFINARKSERKDLYLSSQSIYSNLFADRRSIFSTIATISATIGAFSFLLFDSKILSSYRLLVAGDLLLLITITLSVYFYLFQTREDMISYHKTYYDTFELLSGDIEKGYQVISGKMSIKDFNKWAIEQLGVYKYTRPPEPDFMYHWIVYINFVTALILVMGSLFICY